jgi:hypothetical protein
MIKEYFQAYKFLKNPGMTLVEMLVATTMTLVIMGVVVQLFGMVGNGVTASRASLRMSSELRSVSHTLRTDLNGITVETVPPATVAADAGYLEIVEGSGTDTSLGVTQLTGDADDLLMFTTRSFSRPFVGKLGGSDVIESPYAEVAWFCRQAAKQPVAGSTLYNLYRRQLLIMDYVGAGSFHGTNSINGSLPAAYADNDLSLRRVPGTGRLLPNGLSDVTKRENRFLHNFSGAVSASAFPYENVLANISSGTLAGNRIGEDIVLSNVLAFDVRVFDPAAEVLEDTAAGVAVIAGDPGYSNGAQFSPRIYGAYVDMGAVGSGAFASVNSKSQLTTPTYDTWSNHYEFNGLDEDGNFGIDQKVNLIDDDMNQIVDDSNELETSPPYPVPLRGLEVRIRIYDTSTRQVRQVTVRHTFVPH